ncbi:aldehyde dehydrogenase family protein [Paeniglutamicibacter antarcticus]|uniref:Aldehyde dehydrogenase n=1 Tax=Paeniglutamicibacter antarcticus TaxID=494023 RepID=A0ABP9TR96_9MICC
MATSKTAHDSAAPRSSRALNELELPQVVAESPEKIGEIVASMHDVVATRLAHPRRFRASQLKALERMLEAHEQDFVDALDDDLGKGSVEAKMTEIDMVRAEIDHAQLHLSEWMESKPVKVPLALQPAAAKIEPQPLGVVLVIGAWNYPMQLVLAPLVASIAAGNVTVIKPSELAPATSAMLGKLIPQFMDPRACVVIQGGASTSKVLLEQHFDHIFYTGGERVGKIVARAAAEHLTPVTLELGGKSPAVVMDGSSIAVARRLAFGKFMNAGQTCVAPDYVLSVGDAGRNLEKQLAKAISGFYGKNPMASRDYGRIVNAAHFDRLVSYLGDGEIVIGGGHDRDSLKIEPTVLANVDPDSPLLSEEIFGPILPIVAVDSFDAAVRFIHARPDPLVAYLFSENPRLQSSFGDQVRAGAIVHNAPNLHLAVPALPFGGVGASGMGSYHGRHGFERLSQMRAVMGKTTVLDTLKAVYPPYTWAKSKLIKRLL